ncbi:glutathione S-transferase-like [Dreissena polymorpha]|uniref:Uncharacterized protein n=1 Tax=Dreissena polymorpha TaxID=45954 RepID=A0A9D4GGD7_DREPO|nr:glutathione S-transferase-like [Dreissena polymorpha]KAH3815006.1 hypothetical protein DPMN_143525 [Dreissena polymorpha]
MPKYELHYFNGRGRGEVCRLLFVAAGQAFTDTRVEQAEWPKLKPKMPQETLPVLTIDGKTQVSQSLAIARYLAREFKMDGGSSLQQLFVDEFVSTTLDLFTAYAKAAFSPNKEEEMKKFKSESLPKYYKILDSSISSYGKNGFAVGSSLTLADLFVHTALEATGLDELKDYKNLKANRDKVESIDKIKKYLASRPKTAF